MAAPTELTKGGVSGVSVTSQATGAFTPSANRVLIAAVMSRMNTSVDPPAPTASGWSSVADCLYDSTSTSRKRLAVLVKDSGSSPANQTVTFDFGTDAQTDVNWVVAESDLGYATTSPIGVTATNVNNSTTVDPTVLSVTLGAFSSPLNSTIYVGVCDFAISAPTPSGNTQVSLQLGTNDNDVYLGWNGGEVSGPSLSWPMIATGGSVGAIGFELKLASAASTAVLMGQACL